MTKRGKCKVEGCPCSDRYGHNSHILAARLAIKALRNLGKKSEPWHQALAKQKTTTELYIESLEDD